MTEEPVAPPYVRYASVYDRIGQRGFGERFAESVLAWLAARGRAPRRVADLACGTGAATLIFAAAGCDTLGVDRAPAMLERARQASDAAGLRVDFLEQDIRDLDLPGTFDLVTCCYDSVNYITDLDDLRAFFRGVAAVLTVGGTFAFDLSTRRALAEWGSGCIVAADAPDLFGVYRSWFNATTNLSPLRMTFFVRVEGEEGDPRWERFDEEHVERGYPLDLVTSLLEDAGMKVVELREMPETGGPFGGAGTEECARVAFLAERPATGDEGCR